MRRFGLYFDLYIFIGFSFSLLILLILLLFLLLLPFCLLFFESPALEPQMTFARVAMLLAPVADFLLFSIRIRFRLCRCLSLNCTARLSRQESSLLKLR